MRHQIVNVTDLDFGYYCWLGYQSYPKSEIMSEFQKYCSYIVATVPDEKIDTAVRELKTAIRGFFGNEPIVADREEDIPYIWVGTENSIAQSGLDADEIQKLGPEGFIVRCLEHKNPGRIVVLGKDARGVLYGVFHLILAMGYGRSIKDIETVENTKNRLRMINHWDNLSGEIERGYAGKSIFFQEGSIETDLNRVTDYARLLASVRINGVVINNVNVLEEETGFVTEGYLPKLAAIADVFRRYGIQLYLSINFAAPMVLDGLPTADPLDPEVKDWWSRRTKLIYSHIPDCGGFLVKADSENRPGPFTYGRTHAEGANMLAEAILPYGGVVIWRCFVYNCKLDWRDRSQDRAKAAYENFKPLDGEFLDNVILQVKNGPMDFQIREPISPLFGAMEQTNEMLELQITQEYTGQQKHLCYLVPSWKETLDFDTYACGKGTPVSSVVDGSAFGRKYGGISGVSNIGDSDNWTGHPLAQANFYGFGRLAWNPNLTSEAITTEWVRLTLGNDPQVVKTVVSMLMQSRSTYEKYTCPLGIGWMVNPGYHYGPNVDGYEYSPWGTYHYANHQGLGVERSKAHGTGYTAQYRNPWEELYEKVETCPDELLLFFHHVSYRHLLHSGKTVIQHIYDSHFEGVSEVEEFKEQWLSLKGKIPDSIFGKTLEKINIQIRDAEEWRDVINTYFYRKSGIADIHQRKIYE